MPSDRRFDRVLLVLLLLLLGLVLLRRLPQRDDHRNLGDKARVAGQFQRRTRLRVVVVVDLAERVGDGRRQRADAQPHGAKVLVGRAALPQPGVRAQRAVGLLGVLARLLHNLEGRRTIGVVVAIEAALEIVVGVHLLVELDQAVRVRSIDLGAALSLSAEAVDRKPKRGDDRERHRDQQPDAARAGDRGDEHVADDRDQRKPDLDQARLPLVRPGRRLGDLVLAKRKLGLDSWRAIDVD